MTTFLPSQSIHIVRKTLACTALITLAACGGGSNAPSVPTPLTINTLPVGYVLPFTAGQGLEAINFQTQGAEGSPITAPSMNLTITDVGFNLTFAGLPSGNGTAPFNTGTGSINANGSQQYTSCIGGCIGSLQGRTTVNTTLTNGGASSLSYATYGIWESYSLGAFQGVKGVLAGGIPTTLTQKPAAGTASYTGKAAGYIGDAALSAGTVHQLSGDVSLTADFTANTISGTVTNIATVAVTTRQTQPGPTGIADNITLSGGTITGTSFTGTAAAAATAGATGQFGGAFYGPAAAEAAGSLALTGNGINVVASFGAKK